MSPSAFPGAPALTFPAVFLGGPDFYFSLLVLAIGVAACVYFLIEWFAHGGHHFLLFWAFGFLALYWFQIPTVLANAGVGFALPDFNLFYTISFPLGFLGLLAIYFGIRSAWPAGSADAVEYRIVLAWLAVALALLWGYLAAGSAVATHLLASIVILFFFAPAGLLVLTALRKWYKVLPAETGIAARAGIVTMAVAVVVGFIQGFLLYARILSYPPAFWFVAISNFSFAFVLQAFGLLLLLLGFFLVHHDYRKVRRAEAAGRAAGRTKAIAGDLPKLVVAVVVSELAGIIGSLFTVPSLPNWYANLNLPSFTPPGWVFSVVWVTLFFLIGIAAYLVWREGLGEKKVRTALSAFFVQLALNIGWTAIFFGAHLILFAFVEIIILWFAILWTAALFYRISRPAAALFLPYLIWVAFAAFLTYSVWRLN
jgi:translocator protein